MTGAPSSAPLHDAHRQREWAQQWELLGREEDQPRELFEEWMAPWRLEDLRGKRVLDAGCGGGHFAALAARYAAEVTAMDLNTSELVRGRLAGLPNVRVVDGDLVTVAPEAIGGPFDVVTCIGVLHHTHDPDRGFENLLRLVAPGGLLILWVYSHEGNGVARRLVEPARDRVLRHLPKQALWALSWGLTVPALAAAHTVYRLPVPGLPMRDYLLRQRTLTPRKVAGNVFDKLNAPHTDFIRRARLERWFARGDLTDVHLEAHLGVSWRASARKRP